MAKAELCVFFKNIFRWSERIQVRLEDVLLEQKKKRMPVRRRGRAEGLQSVPPKNVPESIQHLRTVA